MAASSASGGKVTMPSKAAGDSTVAATEPAAAGGDANLLTAATCPSDMVVVAIVPVMWKGGRAKRKDEAKVRKDIRRE